MSSVSAIVLVAATTLIIAIMQALVVAESKTWLQQFSRWLVRSSARGLPDEQRDRYEEEWLGVLVEFNERPLSALGWAAHLRWKARAMRATFGLAAASRGTPIRERILAAIALLVLAPVLAAVALAIRVRSPGPVLWRVYRSAPEGIPALPVAFRTVSLEPHEMPDGTIVLREDDFGRALRRSGLNYLPRYFDVMRGTCRLLPDGVSLRQAVQLGLRRSRAARTRT